MFVGLRKLHCNEAIRWHLCDARGKGSKIPLSPTYIILFINNSGLTLTVGATAMTFTYIPRSLYRYSGAIALFYYTILYKKSKEPIDPLLFKFNS